MPSLGDNITSASTKSSLPLDPILNEIINKVISNYVNKNVRESAVNMVEALQEFWRTKAISRCSALSSGHIVYESQTNEIPPFVCYVTLPGGACFGSFEVCDSKTEARRSAAKVALMNSLLNEHPARRITSLFIDASLAEASTLGVDVGSANDDFSALGAYRAMLQRYKGATMLEFREIMTVFQLLHWNFSLKAMKERSCTREEVISHYTCHALDVDMRSNVALDWIAREKEIPGIIKSQLDQVEQELNEARIEGSELRFFKEKQDILLLAYSQLQPTSSLI